MKTILTQPPFDTITEALNWLTNIGFTHDFNIKKQEEPSIISSEDFSIAYVFRFEGDTDPGDENILFAIQSEKHSLKGVFLSAFGVYADSFSNEIIKKLARH